MSRAEGSVKIQTQRSDSLLDWESRKLVVEADSSHILLLDEEDEESHGVREEMEKLDYASLWSEGAIGFDVVFKSGLSWSLLVTTPLEATHWVETINKCISLVSSKGFEEVKSDPLSLKNEENVLTASSTEESKMSALTLEHPFQPIPPSRKRVTIQETMLESTLESTMDGYEEESGLSGLAFPEQSKSNKENEPSHHQSILKPTDTTFSNPHSVSPTTKCKEESLLALQYAHQEERLTWQNELSALKERYEQQLREERKQHRSARRSWEESRQVWLSEKEELMAHVEEEGEAFRQLRKEVALLQKKRGSREGQLSSELRRLERERELGEEEREVLEQEMKTAQVASPLT